MRRWNVTLVVTCAILACGLGGCQKQQEDALRQVEAASPSLKVTAAKLTEAYKANEVAADGRYKDKVIQVTGGIEAIKKDLGGNPLVIFKKGESKALFRVRCVFGKNYAPAAAKFTVGQTLSVKGLCKGKLGTVNLLGCVPIE